MELTSYSGPSLRLAWDLCWFSQLYVSSRRHTLGGINSFISFQTSLSCCSLHMVCFSRFTAHSKRDTNRFDFSTIRTTSTPLTQRTPVIVPLKDFVIRPHRMYLYVTPTAEGTIADVSINQEIDFAPVIFLGIAISGVFFALAVGSLAGYHWWLAW